MTLSSTYKSELRSRYMTPVIELIKITHSTAPNTVRLADSPTDVTSNGDIYLANKLSAQTPRESKEFVSEIAISIANIDPSLLPPWLLAGQITDPHLFSLYRVRALSPDVIEESYVDCPIVSWNFDGPGMTVICRRETVLGQVAGRLMSRNYFPGNYRDA